MNIISVDEAPNYDQQNQLHHMQIHQPQGEIYVTAISTMNPTMVSTISDMPPKISPPNNELRIEPPPTCSTPHILRDESASAFGSSDSSTQSVR